MSANPTPVLSIVTPTRGNFAAHWLSQLLSVKGNVQFILIYPPGLSPKPIHDSRVVSLISPYKGEMMQRFVGLLNASGAYLLALDDDDFVHPNILDLVVDYFQTYGKSWVLRLKKKVIDFRQTEEIYAEWSDLPAISELAVCRKTADTPNPYQQGTYTGLLELPIAPLDLPFDWRWLVFPFLSRKDNYGYHFENFNNIIWRRELVQATLPELTQTTQLLGVLTWIPNSGFDRLLGLWVQAKHYQPNAIIGHWLPGSEQIRYIDKPTSLKPPRFHVLSDVLLVKAFPRYGYVWNLFFSQLYRVPRTIAKLSKLNRLKRKH
ncbi:glycosyltransferase family 2 protein [Oculatella sp. LEGE 06141]|uniref:glycosyltransferase family A protein n=1 Tax=Oculatella sp. LEGE 06141 TaxID=1828648 RepID=UPI00187DF9D7|nr:glycosyltransferase family A protein [Oculatella sp. LEGE 06141]MBE9178343.1 glycosyltransferase family 2 protein [Oculatella sp. LEGE 06141]